MAENIYAVIDIGSNSVRLLVAECENDIVSPIYKAISTTRLSQGLAVSGALVDSAIERTINAIYSFNIKAIEMGAINIWCFATAAVRNAQNSDKFVSAVKEKVLLDVDILSKEKEAQMGFVGVGGEGIRGIIDIGGGSTEIAVGDGEDIQRCSMDLGAVSALDMYPLGDIADELTLEAMKQWSLNIMSKESASLILNSPEVEFVGIGGTITTLAAMDLKMTRYDPKKVQGRKLTYRSIKNWYDMLLVMPLRERQAIAGIEPQRADIIIGGIVILMTFMELFSLKEIKVSDSGNLEGYLKDKLFG